MANPGAIKDKGTSKKGVLAVAQVSDAWAVITPVIWSGTTGTTLDLGEVNKANPKLATSKEDFKNLAGQVVATDYDYTMNTTATLMERDKLKLDFLASAVKGKYFLEYFYAGIVDGKHQEIFKLVTITPQYNISLPGGATSNEYESTAIIPNTTVTITGTTLGLIETALTITIYCTGVSITNALGHCIKETAVT